MKPIQKKTSRKALNYITFYKFHRASLTHQHPRWTPNQITVIIKMMWKKEKASSRKNTNRKSRAGTNGKSQAGMKKILSGRVTLRRFRNINFIQAKNIWKRLPFESKMMWTQMGNPEFVESDNTQKTFSMKLNKEEDRIGNILMRRMGK